MCATLEKKIVEEKRSKSKEGGGKRKPTIRGIRGQMISEQTNHHSIHLYHEMK